MGPESNATNSPSSSSPGSPTVKRGRDPEDEVYVDNLHCHKRYLTEVCFLRYDVNSISPIMASSLNGLTVRDHLSKNLMDSLVRDEISVQYSPMSEDSDDLRYYECNNTNTLPSQPESPPTSPVSPYRCQKPVSGYSSVAPTIPYPPHSGLLSSASPLQTRHCGSDTEGRRFPSSPSDICHSADLRRAALLRSVQMRTQPVSSSQFELLLGSEGAEQPCAYMKLDDDDNSRCCQVTECTALSISDHENEKPCITNYGLERGCTFR